MSPARTHAITALTVRTAALALALCLTLAGCAAPASSVAEASPSPSASPKPSAVRDVSTGADGEVPTVLPKTKDAGREYLDETLFIGDSNTARYTMYADDTGEPFTTLDNNIGVVSMGVGSIVDLKCEKFKGYSGMYTLPDAVAMLKPKRIIIGFGTNNLSGSSTKADSFIKTYKKGLAAIAKAWPYADIIVSAIPPLDKLRYNTNLTMTQVDAYNEALITMCEEEGYHFLDTTEVLRDKKTGWAKKDYTLSDGVHLSKIAVTALFEYVRIHAYITEDRRPQPLGTIPKPAGVPLGLISEDPIADRRAPVPVEFVASTGGSIQGNTSQQVRRGSSCSAVTAVPNEGYKFSHWSASIGSTGSSATLTFTVPETADANGVIITAHFEAAAHEHQLVDVPGTRTEPTCGQAGTVKRRCTVCDQVFEEKLEATGKHSWGATYTLGANEAGDSERLKQLIGQAVHKCTVCGTIAADPNAVGGSTPTPSPTPATSAKPSASPGGDPGTQATQQPSETPGEKPTESPGGGTEQPSTPSTEPTTPTTPSTEPTTPTTPAEPSPVPDPVDPSPSEDTPSADDATP